MPRRQISHGGAEMALARDLASLDGGERLLERDFSVPGDPDDCCPTISPDFPLDGSNLSGNGGERPPSVLERGADVIDKVIRILGDKDNFPNEKLEIVRRLLEQLEPEVNDRNARPLLTDDELAAWQERPPSDEDGEAGKIPGCRECKDGECCNFGEYGNLIFAAPSEIRRFEDDPNLRTDHLQVRRATDTGANHVFCSVKHDGCVGCAPKDGVPGAKPFDCAIYPAYVETTDEDGIAVWFADNRSPNEDQPPKCQLSWWDKLAQLPFVVTRFREKLLEDPSLVDTYRNAINGMVNYRMFDPSGLLQLTPDELLILLDVGKALSVSRIAHKVRGDDTDAAFGETIFQHGLAVRNKFAQAKDHLDAYHEYPTWTFQAA